MIKTIWRKAVAYVLALMMIISGMPTAFAAADTSDFVDFPTGWSREAVKAAIENGLLYGRTDTTIEPQGNLTRGEMATIINRAFGSKIEADISPYRDVIPTDWYYHEVAKAVNMQVLEGDDTGLMRPEDYITREEVAAVIARALVLESDDYSVLGKYNDKATISDWSKPYVSILTQKGYMQGNDFGNFCAKDNITREEFAQLMHNIFKTYYTDNGEYNKAGADSAIIRTTNVTLKDMTIDGDLVLGDGVGKGVINLENVEIKGRLLCRGGEDTVTLKNTTVGEMVVVKDVNGIVNFHNYRDEAPFEGIIEITPATFLKRTSSGSSGGGGGGGSSSTTKFDVEIVGAGKDGIVQIKKNSNFTFPTLSSDELAIYSSFAGWIVDDDTDTLYAPGSTYKVTQSIKVEAVFYYNIEHYYQREDLSDNYDIDSSLTVRRYAKNGTEITVAEEDLSEKDYYKHDGRQVKGTVSDTSILTLKVYYNINTVTVSFKDEDGSSVYADITGRFESEITLPKAEEVTKNGYVLFGWKDEDGVIYPEGGKFTLRKNETLTAYWTQGAVVTPVSGYVIEIYELKVGGTPGTDSDYIITGSVSVGNIEVGKTIIVVPDDIRGFKFNDSKSNTTEIIVENENVVFKLYYDRIIIPVTYATNGGTAIAGTSVQYGATLTLPDADSTTLDGKILAGWEALGTTYAPAADVVINEIYPVEFKAVWTDAPAIYANYKVEHYQLNVGARNGDVSEYTLFETETIENVLVGSDATAIAKIYKGFTENTDGISVLTGTVEADGSLVLKVYYDRVVINVTFDENGGTPDMTDVSLQYGATLTMPNDDSFAKDGYELVGWQASDGVIYPAGYELTIDSDTDVEYVAYWKLRQPTTYEVIFYDKWFAEVGNVTVSENETVDENDFPNDKLHAVTGYKENAYISPTLYSGENEYVHEVYTDWYFEHPQTGEFILFDETVPVSADIVVDGILEVFPMSPMIDIDVAFDIKNISESFNFSAFYEATVVDSEGNVIKGTRAMDTLKDILWANLNSESGEDSQINAFAREYIDKALGKLAERALIDENHNIRLLDLFIKFSQIIGDEELEDYIVDNAKETLKDNEELLVSILKYYDSKYANGNATDKNEVEGIVARAFEKAVVDARQTQNDALMQDLIALCEEELPEYAGQGYFEGIATNDEFLAEVAQDLAHRMLEEGRILNFEEYVPYIIEYLKETNQFDEVIDEVIETEYRDDLDKMVYQLINEDAFDIDPSNSFILSAFEMQIKKYSFDELIKGVPEAVFKIYPREKLEEIYSNAYDNLLAQIEVGKISNQSGEVATIDTGLTFVINPVDDIYVPLRDRAVEILSGVDKLNNNYYYSENAYLQELIKLTEVSNLVDTSAQSESGYKLKDYNDYYDLILRAVIIGDDALCWYTEELTSDELDKLMLDYEDLAIKYANAIADMIEAYATDGTLPEKLDNGNVRAIESAIRDRFPGLLDKALDWYVESPVNKEYNEDDYAKVRSAVRKVFENINITTDEAFEIPAKVIVKLVEAFKEKDEQIIAKLDEVLDNVVKTGENEYSGTLRGRTVTVKLEGDVYYITFQGRTVKVSLSGDEYTVSYNGKTAKYSHSEDQYSFVLSENNNISVKRSIK